MKIRLADLEKVRGDPASYRAGHRSLRAGGGMNRRRALILAIHRYHHDGNDIEAATSYFHDLYLKHFPEDHNFELWRSRLLNYHTRFLEQGNEVSSVNFRERVVASDLLVEATVPRLDLVPSGGYAAWFFETSMYPWEQELRMPILQRHLASRFWVDPSLVSVGIYVLESGQYVCRTYSSVELDEAFAELLGLASELVG
jgi:hypothetical protein